jgi:hypothetical protein
VVYFLYTRCFTICFGICTGAATQYTSYHSSMVKPKYHSPQQPTQNSFKNMGGMEVINNMNKPTSWFLPVMANMHHRYSWRSSGGHPGKTVQRRRASWIKSTCPSISKIWFQIGFSMPERLLYPWISSKLFRLSFWPCKATFQPYPSDAQNMEP